MESGRILVIEDDRSTRETLREILELEGFEVIEASNGLEGLHELGRGSNPSLVLLDLMMPVMNGWQFLEELEKRPLAADLPVLVVSAVGHPDREALRGVPYLTKPIDIDELLDEIRRHAAPSGEAENGTSSGGDPSTTVH